MTTRCQTWAVIGLMPVALVVGCGPAPETPPTAATGTAPLPTVTVTVAPLKVRPVERSVVAVGTLSGSEEATLAPKVDGRVVALHADVGDVVAPGAVLLDLDPTDYHLAVAEARQGLVVELARLGLTELPAEGYDVRAVPAVRRAVVAQEDAARRLKVKRDLLARNVASRDEFDLAETDLKLAEATTAQAVTEARAVLAATRLRKASLDTAEQKLADCKLRAPVPAAGAAGVKYLVAQRLLSEGEMVRSMPVTNAFKLVVAESLELHAAVPERYTPDVKVGQAVEVRVDAYPGAAFAGRVARVNPTVDPLNRTFDVEVAVPNADGRLRCGGFARAAIRVRTDPQVKTVPREAVTTFAGVTKLFVAAGDAAKAVPVEIGTRERDWVEVVGDVPADAVVVTSGQSQLVDGSPIKVRETSAAVPPQRGGGQ
jgi:RND family efflux transporter MFP subunit